MGLDVILSAPTRPASHEPAALRRWPEAARFTELTGLHIADVTQISCTISPVVAHFSGQPR
jgi:hypothetical protein